MSSQRQYQQLSHELWSGQGVCIFAIDALEIDADGVAFFDDGVVYLAFGLEVFMFNNLSESTIATIILGQSGIVEFGPEGPLRETPIGLVI